MSNNDRGSWINQKTILGCLGALFTLIIVPLTIAVIARIIGNLPAWLDFMDFQFEFQFGSGQPGPQT
jgi:hypothetical protein